MKYSLAFLLIFVLTAPSVAQSQFSGAIQQESLVFTHVTVLDMTSAPAKPDMTVVIVGDHITAVGKSSNVGIPKNAQVVDATGKYLIPGLWDMHVHIFNNSRLTSVGMGLQSERGGTNNKDTYFPLLIANGLTGVRDMWTDPEDLKLVRQWERGIQAGEMLGPHIAPGSSIVDGVPTFLPNMLGVSTPEEARRSVRMLKDAGAGFIKVYWNLSPEAYYAIADEAKRLSIPFAGHVPFSMSAADASVAGQKSIEHLTGIFETCSTKETKLRRKAKEWTSALNDEMYRTYDDQKCHSLFVRFAKNGTWHTPTIALHRMLAFRTDEDFKKDPRLRYIPIDTVQEWLKPTDESEGVDPGIHKIRFQKMLETVGEMHRVGVPLLAGTDIGNPFLFPGFSLHDELELFVQAGLTPFEALKTATVNPAKYLGISDSLGTIEKGKIADLVLLDANPLESISNIKKIDTVVANGRYLPRESLRAMLTDVEAKVSQK